MTTIPFTDYLLTTDELKVGEMLSAVSKGMTEQQIVKYCMKMTALSEKNLTLMTVELKRKNVQYQRQLKNATYWQMAVDLAKEDLKGGLQ